MSPKTAASPQVLSFAAYVCTDQGADVAREIVQLTGTGEGALHGGGLSGAARLSTDIPIAQTLIAEIGNIPVPMACESVAEIRKSGAEVIVLGHQSDIATYRALRGAGALEYFAFPVTAAEILEIQTQPVANDPTPLSVMNPCIGVVGSNGGVGASVLAQNLAFYSASANGANFRTALLDVDLRFGSQAIDIDLEGTPGLLEALTAPDRIDSTFLEATMTKVQDQLFLYSHQAQAGQDITQLEAAMAELAGSLRTEFGAVVLDVPRMTLLAQPGLTAKLDALVLVIPAGYSGVNAASRLITRIKDAAPDLRILPVLSEVRNDAGLSAKDIAKAIGHDIVATLPRNDKALTRAQRAAAPMIKSQPRCDYAKTVRKIWKASIAASAMEAAPKRRSILTRMFK